VAREKKRKKRERKGGRGKGRAQGKTEGQELRAQSSELRAGKEGKQGKRVKRGGKEKEAMVYLQHYIVYEPAVL
jgi:hypothetical protein